MTGTPPRELRATFYFLYFLFFDARGNRPNSTADYMGGVDRGERNVNMLNIVKLAHGLKVRPAKRIETIR